MNIVVPIAGRGSRFSSQGISLPKPLIQVAGKPMVAWGLKSIEGMDASSLIFVALREHEESFGITAVVADLTQGAAQVILLEDVTEGQVCTVLAARPLIDSEEDLLIISADTYVVSDLGRDIRCRPADCAGIISVANLPGERWSFARADESGRVVEVAEKTRISSHAGTGLYYFSSGRQFVHFADEMIRNRETTRGEYYVMPLYRKFIEAGHRILLSQTSQVWDMGNPQALREFEAHLQAERTS
jgi:UDP-N-acetylglucosamine diphosphorylase / glucose-1-phosphate thymidylyltransferase / UDP-N-acetylgalactosamine diphosphorylase / glucosamine-1-phosphate N-acetyltransferase / galactosamine-1-phosphate N-acetyltransferase